jgi:ribosome-binding protein aMBF1 (putative translation factor)
MQHLKTLHEWLTLGGLTPADLAARSRLDVKVVEAILAVRYTTSPEQRQRIAAALGIAESEVKWSTAVGVDSMYGHGPQFGRSP